MHLRRPDSLARAFIVFSLVCFHSLDKLIISCHVLVRDVKMAFVAVQTLAALGGQRSPSNASDPGARIE